MAEQRKGEPRPRGWRDKPVHQEGDKDIKEAGMEGAAREVEEEEKETEDGAGRPKRRS
ncbi:MAG TPA: hypothetical protein VFA50_12985 [Stellaceae bacterium]|nr:hypothetical protein [Stellaceae bacterium]